jgi:cellulose synthase/poly-beta-1,6-N-acetylglucosamine synthase-like glycosyltransferase
MTLTYERSGKSEAFNMPPITLIIPSRERADVLLYALKTAVAQDYANLRILVSDNASTDNTREVVASFKGIAIQVAGLACPSIGTSHCPKYRSQLLLDLWAMTMASFLEPST